jgi:hypothetical protein
MAVLSINSLDMPPDFPAEKFEAVYKKLRDAYSGRPQHEELVVGALNAVAYRFKSLAECDESFTDLIKAHASDQRRYEQERDLFGFFSNFYSVFDAFCFVREILTHRAVPPRAFMITAGPSPASSDVIPRLNMTIDATTTASRKIAARPVRTSHSTSQPSVVSATRWEGALGASLKAAPHIAAPLLPRALAP